MSDLKSEVIPKFVVFRDGARSFASVGNLEKAVEFYELMTIECEKIIGNELENDDVAK